MNVCLIGARGVGKTRTARRLAVILKRPVVSTDVLVTYECGGRTIAKIIQQKGWRVFRRKEFDVLKKIVRLKDVIVDCGGGIVVDLDKTGRERYSPRKARLLRKNAVVVWLKGNPDRGGRPRAGDSKRPALSGTASVREIMNRRKPFYKRAAHAVIRVENLGAKTIAKQILKKLKLSSPA